MVTIPAPPNPFDADEDLVPTATQFYRIASSPWPVGSFNPGNGSPTRFAFFGNPSVPVLYAADTEEAALAESILHDVPATGGTLLYDDYASKVMGRLTVTRDLRLAKLRGLGLRRLKITAQQISDTPASTYPKTVRWAEAAHNAGFDGLSYTSRLCNDARAVVLFGDRAKAAIDQDQTYARIFAGTDLDWLIDICAPLHVDVLPPS